MDTIQEILDQPPMRRLTAEELAEARDFLGLDQTQMGLAWAKVAPDLERSRTTVCFLEGARHKVSRELSHATRILVARKIASSKDLQKRYKINESLRRSL